MDIIILVNDIFCEYSDCCLECLANLEGDRLIEYGCYFDDFLSCLLSHEAIVTV